MSSVPEVRNPLLGAGEVIWKPEYSSNTGSRGNRGNPYQWAFGYPNAMLAGTSAATQGRQGRAIPHPLPGAGIRPRRPGSWPRSEQQQRQDHRQPVGVVSRLDTAHGCSSTQAAAKGPPERAREAPGNHTRTEARQDRAAAQTAAKAARRSRGRLWQPLPGREAQRIQGNAQAAHRATRAGPGPHPLPGGRATGRNLSSSNKGL